MNKWYEKKFGFDILSGMEIIYCGKRDQSINHKYGPYTLGTYIITLVTEGEALLHYGENEAVLKKDHLLVMFPRSGVYYSCTKDVPWSIKWVVVKGDDIEKYLSLIGITQDKPYIKMNSTNELELSLDRLFSNFENRSLHNKIRCIADIHLLFAAIAEDRQPHETTNPINKAVEYIEQNFHKRISVGELARLVGMSYNYFSALFKSETSYTPREMINNYKLDKAKKLLLFTDKSVREISIDVGFNDELYFSRLFKKHIGLSPMKFRIENSSSYE